jgi:hypothetical protein
MTRAAIVIAALAVAATGCAHGARSTAVATEPSASIPDTAPLAGHWQGTLWETGGSYWQGASNLDIVVKPDGTWHGTIAKMPAAGTATLRRGQLIISGTAVEPNGHTQPIYYRLKGGDVRRWGETTTIFTGREARAAVELSRTGA